MYIRVEELGDKCHHMENIADYRDIEDLQCLQRADNKNIPAKTVMGYIKGSWT